MGQDERRAKNRERMARLRAANPEEWRKRDREAKQQARRLDSPYAQRVRVSKRSPEAKARRNELRRRPEVRAHEAARLRRRRQDPEFKEKERARRELNYAVARGDITPPSMCGLCGKDPGLRTNGRRMLRADHHHGYDQAHWLDVQWVCPPCDGKLERERGNTTLGKWSADPGPGALE